MFHQYQILDEAVAQNIASRLQQNDWEKGRTRTKRADTTVKFNEEQIPKEGDPLWDSAVVIKDALTKSVGFVQYTMFTKMTIPKFNRYTGSGTYKRHFDAAQMGGPELRTDFACTIALNSSDDYEGGDLHIETWEGDVIKAPRMGLGVGTVYECGQAHWVSPVTRGERVSAIIWMRSMVADPEKRKLLYRFSHLLIKWEQQGDCLDPNSPEYTTLIGIQTALCRMWMDA